MQPFILTFFSRRVKIEAWKQQLRKTILSLAISRKRKTTASVRLRMPLLGKMPVPHLSGRTLNIPYTMAMRIGRFKSF